MKCGIWLRSGLVGLMWMAIPLFQEAPIAGSISSNIPVPSSGCINVSGSYATHGRPIGDMPDFYRVGSLKPTLDRLLGIDLRGMEQTETTRAELMQLPEGIKLSMWADGRLPIRVSLDKVNGHTFRCDDHSVTLRQVLQGKGEAVSGRTTITRTLSLDEDRSLLVHVLLVGRNRTLFFFWTSHEEYGVRYERLEER